MDLNLFRAVLVILKQCIEQEDCRTCPFKDFCGKIPSEWV